jgi:predicted small secreted protein
MKMKVLSAEAAIGSASTVSNASVVRLYNSSADTAFLITNSNTATFTMPAGSVAYVIKEPTETLTSNAAVLATSIAYS